MPPHVTPYTWNPTAKRFIAPSGQFVSLEEVRAGLDSAIAQAALKNKILVDDLVRGTISVFEFERLMQVAIKDTQLYAAAVAAGGYSAISGEQLVFLTQRVSEQFAYLAEWVHRVGEKEGDVNEEVEFEETEKAMAARAAMYAQSARRTFEAMWKSQQVDAGKTEERNVLGNAEHCAQCVDMSAIGWVLIGTLIPIGERTCLSNCKCRILYR
jgi:hypothetical protein